MPALQKKSIKSVKPHISTKKAKRIEHEPAGIFHTLPSFRSFLHLSPSLIGRRNVEEISDQCFGVLRGRTLSLPWRGLGWRRAPSHPHCFRSTWR